MKTSELIENMAHHGYSFYADNYFGVGQTDWVSFRAANGDWLAVVNTQHEYKMQIDFSGGKLTAIDKRQLLRWLIDYAQTPVEKRQNEPKFSVHLLDGDFGWLRKSLLTGEYAVGPRSNDHGWTAIFDKQAYDNFFKHQKQFNGMFLWPYDQYATNIFVPAKDGDGK